MSYDSVFCWFSHRKVDQECEITMEETGFFFTSPLQSSLLEVHVLCDCEEFAKDSKQLVYL